MATTEPKILPEHIEPEQPVIHPALDWRHEILLMGVRLPKGVRGVLTSKGEILRVDQLPWTTCERGRSFDRSPVTGKVAELLHAGCGHADSGHPLVDLPTQLAAYYRRFIVFAEPWWPDVLALWTLGTYLYPIFGAYPYLRISSPEPGCGKSLLGQIIANLSFNGELMVSPTEANIYRLAESERGTQVWDEVEHQSESERSRLEAMKGVLLNGYRSGATVPRQERTGRQFQTVRFHLYVPRVLIGLSELPTVVQQRTIDLLLHRRSEDEKVERYLPDEREQEEVTLKEMCALYALAYCHLVAERYRDDKLAGYLEKQLGQAGRFPHDLLLPLVAVCAAPIRINGELVRPMVAKLIFKIAPNLANAWNDAATTTPPWLAAALDVLEEATELIAPADLADRISKRTGNPISAEQASHRLKKYGIKSHKEGGKRVFSVSRDEIEGIRKRYNINKPEEPKLLPPAADTPAA